MDPCPCLEVVDLFGHRSEYLEMPQVQLPLLLEMPHVQLLLLREGPVTKVTYWKT